MIAPPAADTGGAPPQDDTAPRLRVVDDLEPLTVVGDPAVADPICLFTLHDGDAVPRDALGTDADTVAAHPELNAAFVRRRDWGASLVAREIGDALGLKRRANVPLARVILDAGRFPGVSPRGVPPSTRRAVSPPLADLITGETKHHLIAHYYDAIARGLARWMTDARIILNVRTYMPDGPHCRPASSIQIVNRRMRYTAQDPSPGQPPDGVFDPLFPATLFGPNCNRSLMLQTVVDQAPDARAARLDHAYMMPEGSVEIRTQVWAFFRFLRRRFNEVFPRTRDDIAYRITWAMLLDVTRRSLDAELLRGYLHSYREAPADQRALFAEARRAYVAIGRFLDLHQETLVHGYRFSTERPSCITVEVRKDLFFELDLERGTARRRADAVDNARAVAQGIAPLVLENLHAFFPDTVWPTETTVARATAPAMHP